MGPYEERAFTIGNVIGEALSLYRQFFLHFASIALAVFLVTSFVSALALLPDSDTIAAGIVLIGILIGIVGFYFVQGALTLAVDDVRDGRVDVSYGALITRALPQVPPLFALGLLIGIVLGGGSFVVVYAAAKLGVFGLGVLVVAIIDLFFVTRWTLATALVVLERLGPVAAVKRSWSLVSGHSWRVFFIIVITGFMAGIGAAILSGILSALLSGFAYVWLSSALVNGLATPFLALTWTLMYFHLRPLPAGAATGPLIPAGAAFSDE